MKIAVNTRALNMGELGGYGFFIEEIFSRITRLYPEYEFYFISEKPFSFEFSSLSNVKEINIKPLIHVNRIRRRWFNWRISSLVKKIKADILINVDDLSGLKTDINQLIIVYDIHFLHTSKSQTNKNKKAASNKFSKSAIIITASESLKKDIQKELQLPEKNFQVVAHPPSSLFQPVEEREKEKIKILFADGNEYFIYKVLTQSDKKLFILLKAFSAFKKKQKSNMKLLIVLSSANKSIDLLKQLKTYKYRDDVKVIEITNKQTLAKLVAGAYALIDLSGNEHFSYSGQEAIQCHTAAIVSNNSVVSETEKETYLYVNNDNYEDVAQKMMFLYKDENLRTKLIENGKKRPSFLSWDEAAKKMWDCIQQASSS